MSNRVLLNFRGVQHRKRCSPALVHTGELETIGVSKKGASVPQARTADRFPVWWRRDWRKVTDPSIDPDEIFRHCLLSQILERRPDKMPIGIDWPADIYMEPERRWEFLLDDEVVPITDATLELVSPSLTAPIRFACGRTRNQGIRAGFHR